MAVLIISAADTQSLVDKVNAAQIDGPFIPVGGILYKDAVWFQIMQSGDAGLVPYVLAETGNDVAFAARANDAEALGCVALGTPLTHAGRIIQAFGAPTVTGTTPAEVLVIINAADTLSGDYDGLTDYVLGIINASGGLEENDPLYAGLRTFIQKVIDAQP